MLGSILSTIGNVAGGIFGAKYNAKKQEEFAKHSLGWKLEDAEKHGVSKYFAAGAPTSNFAPVSTGGMDFSGIGNAIDKTMGQGGPNSTTGGKVSGINGAIAQAQLDGLRIDNDIKRTELASKVRLATQPGAGNMLGIPGPTGVEPQQKVQPTDPNHPQRSYAVSPEVDMYKTPTGWAPAPPQNLAEVHENNMAMRWQWMARNQLLPFMYDENKTPPGPAPAGAYWSFSPLTGEYTLVQKRPIHRAFEDWWARRNRQEHTR